MMLPADAEIIGMAQQDIRHFEPLYEKYFGHVFRFVYGRMERSEDASDLTSEVFMKAMAGLGGYKVSATSFLSWLLVIARNEVAGFYRKRKTELRYFASSEGVEQITRDTEYEASEAYFPIRRLLEMLPPHDFELIDLKYFNKKSVREISEITGIPPNRIRVRMHRIRERLARMIRDRGPDLIYYSITTLFVLMFNLTINLA
jgi:RNA polymerase sigma-70 factor, ECF subfamily